jgi:hypothetical protein
MQELTKCSAVLYTLEHNMRGESSALAAFFFRLWLK